MSIIDSSGFECTQEDWDALWSAFDGNPEEERLLSMLMGVLTHPEMVHLWKMTAVMPSDWDVEAAVKVFPDLNFRSAERVQQALDAMRSHPPRAT